MDTIWNASFSTDMDFQNDAEAARIVDLSDNAFVSFRNFTPIMYLASKLIHSKSTGKLNTRNISS